MTPLLITGGAIIGVILAAFTICHRVLYEYALSHIRSYARNDVSTINGLEASDFLKMIYPQYAKTLVMKNSCVMPYGGHEYLFVSGKGYDVAIGSRGPYQVVTKLLGFIAVGDIAGSFLASQPKLFRLVAGKDDVALFAPNIIRLAEEMQDKHLKRWNDPQQGAAPAAAGAPSGEH